MIGAIVEAVGAVVTTGMTAGIWKASTAGVAAQAIMQSMAVPCAGADLGAGSQWPAIMLAAPGWTAACAACRPNGAISKAARIRKGTSRRTRNR